MIIYIIKTTTIIISSIIIVVVFVIVGFFISIIIIIIWAYIYINIKIKDISQCLTINNTDKELIKSIKHKRAV